MVQGCTWHMPYMWEPQVTTRVQVRDPAMNITASYDTEDPAEAIRVGADLRLKRPDLIVEIIRVPEPAK